MQLCRFYCLVIVATVCVFWQVGTDVVMFTFIVYVCTCVTLLKQNSKGFYCDIVQ